MHEVITEILQGQEKRVKEVIKPYTDKILQVTDILLEQERLSGADFRKLVFNHETEGECDLVVNG